MQDKVKIAIDAMGGDNSPDKVLDGIEISLKNNKENFLYLYGNKKLTFDIEPAKKKRLLEGLDNIGLSLKKIPNIEKFENSMNKTKPWI